MKLGLLSHTNKVMNPKNLLQDLPDNLSVKNCLPLKHQQGKKKFENFLEFFCLMSVTS